jgi:hypothetical protein
VDTAISTKSKSIIACGHRVSDTTDFQSEISTFAVGKHIWPLLIHSLGYPVEPDTEEYLI